MAWNELSWAATIEPLSRPLSCWGKKPFGTTMKRYTLSAQVRPAISSTVRG